MKRPPAASRVFLVEPVHFRYNPETVETNAFQTAPSRDEEERFSLLAVEQHHRLRDLLIEHGVSVTLARSLETSPDAPFCNNWFSTHPASERAPATLVLYPLLAENRRIERRGDLVALLRPSYPRVVDFSPNERKARFLESTGSLVLDHGARTAYAALSPRTDRSLAAEWARELGYRLIPFTAVDRSAGENACHARVDSTKRGSPAVLESARQFPQKSAACSWVRGRISSSSSRSRSSTSLRSSADTMDSRQTPARPCPMNISTLV